MTRWPVLYEHYDDEYGPIAPDMSAAAAVVWSRAQSYARCLLGDDDESVSLMVRAIGDVSKYRERGGIINHLPSYLLKTFRWLVQAKKDEIERHRELEEANQERLVPVPVPLIVNIEDKILVRQLLERMDLRTREVAELLMLDHKFKDIAKAKRLKPATVRDRFRKKCQELLESLNRKG